MITQEQVREAIELLKQEPVCENYNADKEHAIRLLVDIATLYSEGNLKDVETATKWALRWKDKYFESIKNILALQGRVPKYTEEELDEILPKKSSHMICGTTYHTDKDAGFNEAIDICKKALLKERG